MGVTRCKKGSHLKFIKRQQFVFKQTVHTELQKVHRKYLQSFEIWCRRRMKVIWTDRVKNKEVLPS
jgi:hypothetical protein